MCLTSKLIGHFLFLEYEILLVKENERVLKEGLINVRLFPPMITGEDYGLFLPNFPCLIVWGSIV